MNSRPQIPSQPAACQDDALAGLRAILRVTRPGADVELIRQAYDSGDALGMSVAGKLWQAPQPRRKFTALRAEQINLLSRTQAFQLYRLLVPSS